MPDPFKKPSKTKKILKILKAIFLVKFPMNILSLFIIIILSIFGFNYIAQEETPTGNVILEQQCPECLCEEQGITLQVKGMADANNEQIIERALNEVEGVLEANADYATEKVTITYDSSKINKKKINEIIINEGYTPIEEKECEQDCDLCPVKTKVETKNIIYYECPHGALVENLDDCVNYLPNASGEYSGTVEGITLAIDNIEIEKDEEDSGFVTRVDYTIINRGEFPIAPKIEVKVYEEWTLKVKKSVANKVINPEIVVNPNDYVKRQDRVRIFFKGKEQTVRLLLVDSLPTIEREIVAVTRDIDLDYAD